MEESFLGHIRDNPDDDTTRLVYADWLEEHGQQDHATLIRLQCNQETTYPINAYEMVRDITTRERDRLRSLFPYTSFRFERGFAVEAKNYDHHTFIQKGDELFAQLPLLTHFNFGSVSNATLCAIAQCPWLSRLRGITFTTQYGRYDRLGWECSEGLQALLSSPHLRKLEFLRIDCAHLTPQNATVIATAPALETLSILELPNNSLLGDRGLEVILEAPFRLEKFDFSFNRCTSQGLANIATAKSLSKLTHLTLNCYHEDHDGRSIRKYPNSLPDVEPLTTIIEGKYLPELTHLDFFSNGMGTAHTQAMAEQEGLRRFQYMDLSGNDLKLKDAQLLDRSPYLSPDCEILVGSYWMHNKEIRKLSSRFRQQDYKTPQILENIQV